MINTITEAKKTLISVKLSIENAKRQNDAEILSYFSALEQILNIAEVVQQKDKILNPDEITDIGKQALSLIDNLIYKLGTQLSEYQHAFSQITLSVAQWLIAHDGVLTDIQSIVDALAFLANTLQDEASLAELAYFMSQIAHACSKEIINDLDNANPSRPWRVLNLNRGIVATRSHNLNIMNDVFPELIKAIPLDAPDFFKEGMTEMIRLNYPEQVTTLMQHYHDQSKLPAVH